MLFNSGLFIFVFFPICFFTFLLITRRFKMYSTSWLGFASAVFYGYWSPGYLILLLASVSINYLFGQRIAPGSHAARLIILYFAIFANLVLLCYFKYAAFFFFDVLGISHELPVAINDVLPLGISIYTFTQITYLVDCYRGDIDHRKSGFIHYLLFVMYFPHLISGPIVHHNQMIPQFLASRGPSRSQLLAGTALFLMGMAKKVLVADSLAPIANELFRVADVGPVLFWQGWFGTLAYSLQIYFDFSGYSDMAAGLSLLLGFRLPANFNSPYQAASIIEFWNRWHMSLSRFLRDYLYIPLGGNRKGDARRYVNLFVTMLLGGLWHGAGFGFLMWGAIHGALLATNHAARRVFPNWKPPHGLAVAVTFLLVSAALVPFRAVAVAPTLIIWKSLIGLNGFDLPTLTETYLSAGVEHGASTLMDPLSSMILLFAAGLIVFLLPNSLRVLARYRPVLDDLEALPADHWLRWRPSRRWVITTGCLGGAAIAVALSSARQEFLYFQF